MSSEPSRQTCLVTGTSGYVGSELSVGLESKGWTVTRCTRSQPKVNERLYDLRDEVVPVELFAGQDAIVHCAYDFSPVSFDEAWRVSVGGAERLFHAARLAGVKKLVHISSISSFEGAISTYGKVKYAIEQIVSDCGGSSIRPGLVFGGQTGGMFGRIKDQVLAKRVVPTVGLRGFKQYLVHVSDLVRAVDAELRMPPGRRHRLVTVAHPSPWTLRGVTQKIAASHGRSIVVVPVPWMAVWLALRLAECIGKRGSFKSDSVISLVFQNPQPLIDAQEKLGFEPRPFGSA